jgi:LmbE family N-acetylglucosaminyl deacetylase
MRRQKNCITLFAFLFLTFGCYAQSSQIIHELKKLQHTQRVLYMAAHPDDENTRLISYLANEVGAETAYLSLTRGDGGQNLIGNELSEKLGVLRTQELMQARKIDGGKQFFTRAVDFGYSKTADETLEKWNKEELLSDVVYVIRQFRPDVIITRFPPDARAGHGHHTASAILAQEAFDKAADPNYEPDQLNAQIKLWQPTRLYWNTSVWWGLPLDSLYEVTDDYIRMDVGGYDANLGKSYNELASLSRTQHKSQGFGVSIARGSQLEYLKHEAGPKATDNMFDGIPNQWAGYGAGEIDDQLVAILEAFDPQKPEESLQALFELRNLGSKITNTAQQSYFYNNLDGILWMASGLRVEALGEKEFVYPKDSLKVRLELLNRSNIEASLKSYSLEAGGNTTVGKVNEELSNGITKIEAKALVPRILSSQPYWLAKPFANMFSLADMSDLGKPENDPQLKAVFIIKTPYGLLKAERAVRYKYSDRVEGEIEKPVAIIPPLLVDIAEDNLLFIGKQSKQLNLRFQNPNEEPYTVKASAVGFEISPSSFEVKANQTVMLEIRPLNDNAVARLQLTYADDKVLQTMTELDYGHIDKRIVLKAAAPKLVSMRLAKKGTLVGYIPGAGDNVADAIRQMGFEVDILNEAAIRTYDLSKYKAIVTGIRAYNTEEWLPSVHSILLNYIDKGGNFIVQYNTRSRDLLSTQIGPYDFTLSRERVTEEDASVRFTLPEHPVLNKPNKISMADFDGWVQERGLYFASEWNDAFSTPLAWHDKGEPDRLGGLLIAPSGSGAFIYTGISFFRELPAGVPGAYRLLANLISYEAKP